MGKLDFRSRVTEIDQRVRGRLGLYFADMDDPCRQAVAAGARFCEVFSCVADQVDGHAAAMPNTEVTQTDEPKPAQFEAGRAALGIAGSIALRVAQMARWNRPPECRIFPRVTREAMVATQRGAHLWPAAGLAPVRLRRDANLRGIDLPASGTGDHDGSLRGVGRKRSSPPLARTWSMASITTVKSPSSIVNVVGE